MNEEIVEEIYNKLVERFGITEIFLPKYGKTRLRSISWKQFITAALLGTDLQVYCGYACNDTLSTVLSRKYPSITKEKGAVAWPTYLLHLVNKKVCGSCKETKNIEFFSKDIRGAYSIRRACKACDKEYRDVNKHLCNARDAKRRAFKLKATPNWANLIAIKEIYRTCPEGYHVDHIVPLQSKLVCGLHCEFNLQHLPASENISKSNKFTIV
jgi:hypothetical protein